MESDKETRKDGGKGKERGSNLWFPFALILFCVALEYFTATHLPQQGNLLRNGPLGVTDTFSVANARKNLVELTGFGPRVTGAKVTEEAIPQYLKDKIKALSKDLPSSVKIEVDQQNPASNFYLDFLGGMTNVRTPLPVMHAHEDASKIFKCPNNVFRRCTRMSRT